jgi:hypothetical protein
MDTALPLSTKGIAFTEKSYYSSKVIILLILTLNMSKSQ